MRYGMVLYTEVPSARARLDGQSAVSDDARAHDASRVTHRDMPRDRISGDHTARHGFHGEIPPRFIERIGAH